MKTLHLCFIALIFGTSGVVVGQTWPAKPVRLVVPYSAGGSGDIVARAIAQKMSEGLSQQVLVENRAGASGNIGAEQVARSPADGYTLLIATYDNFVISPALGLRLPFDPVKDFEPVSLVANLIQVLAAHPLLPANNMRELVAAAKAQPGKINYASTGPGSMAHISMEFLKRLGDFNVTHVPYKGSAQALPDLISGQIQLMQLGLPQSQLHLKSGRLKVLGIASAKRIAELPQVPTIAEQGFPGYEVNVAWFLLAPAGTPRNIVTQLSAEATRVVALADVRERFIATGLEPVGAPPDQLAARLRDDRAKWAKVINEAGIRVE